ncbi:hypothetical protein LCGC14_0420240 [marine sediment metagenome]|uniref:Uncharacterized protein n=1 Tax=marine sediment metagenome TaxID=412755 RepID=A0A0F9SQW8_9ZZZZ
MGYEETVMTRQQQRERDMRRAQVITAFKAGEEQGKAEGRREAVELIDTKKDLVHEGYHGYAGKTPNPKCKGCQIEAFLKEKGI